MEGFDSLGADEVGFDYGAFLQTAGGVAQYGISAAEQDKKEKETAAAEKSALAAAIAADLAASNAAAKADVSAQLKSASAGIDATAAQMASAAQDRAGAALVSATSQKSRADAADKTLAAVVKNAQAKPKDGYAQALVKAWQATVNKAHSGAIASGASEGKGDRGTESFWTRRVVGPIPGAGVVAIGAGLLATVGVVVKKVFFK